MPMKFKPSDSIFDKQNNRVTRKHYYMSQVSNATLIELLGKDSTTPRMKDKIRTVLVKRGVS